MLFALHVSQWTGKFYFTARQRSCGKVMFQCVCSQGLTWPTCLLGDPLAWALVSLTIQGSFSWQYWTPHVTGTHSPCSVYPPPPHHTGTPQTSSNLFTSLYRCPRPGIQTCLNLFNWTSPYRELSFPPYMPNSGRSTEMPSCWFHC